MDEATEAATKASKELSKVGGISRAKEVLKGGLRLGGGLICSAVSNIMGIKAYNKTMSTATEDLKKQATSLMNTPIKKDTTYRIVILDKTTKFEEVNKENQLIIDQMNEELKIDPTTNKSKGTILYWEPTKENPLPPYQRKLSNYEINLDTRMLYTMLKNSGIPDDGSREKIREKIASKDSQKIIKRYSMDPETRLSENEIFAGQEMVAAIIAASDTTPKELEEEALKGEGKIKTATQKLLQNLGKQLEEIQFNKDNKAKVKIDSQVAKEIFKDEKRATILYVLSNAWNLTVFK